MDTELVLQLLKNGLVLGLLYGLVAFGLSLVLGTTGVFHVAHVTTLVAGAYGMWWLLDHSVWAPFAVAGACGAAVLVGLLIELVIYAPLRRANASDLVLMVASLTVMTLGQGLFAVTFGSDTKALDPSPFMTWRTDVGGVVVRTWDILVSASAVVVFMILFVVQRFTAQGLAWRALGDNADLAASRGIDVGRAFATVVAISSAVAGLAGVLLVTDSPARPTMGFDLLIITVVVLVLGGVGSMSGAAVAGVVIGVLESFLTYITSSSLSHVAIFGLLFALVVLRPTGLRKNRVRVA